MFILNIATSLEGGAGIGLWRYHRALIGAGVDSRILVLQTPKIMDASVSNFQWRKYSLPVRLVHRLGIAHPRPDRLKKKIARLDRDANHAAYELFTVPFSQFYPEDHPWIAEAGLISLHWTAGALDWPRFFARVRKPVVFTLHDQQPYLGGFHYAQDASNNPHLAGLDERFRIVKKNALSGRKVGVIANSRWNADEARASKFYAPETPIETIYYPIDTTVFSPRPKAEAKASVGARADQFVIGFASENLGNKRKGFDLLIEAIDLLPSSLRDRATLLSFGRDPGPDLKARMTLPWLHLGFLATDEAKVAAYAAMDVFVAPSRAEAFGLTALEAEAVGTPVVASDVGGLREAVPACVAPTASDLSQGINAFANDPAMLARRSEDGRKLALERHAPSLIGRQLAAFYKRMAA